MNCYNCGVELTEHDFCTNCGADVVHYKKVISVSNFYYNDGLEKANVRDLSGAIVSLTECLKLNKFNIEKETFTQYYDKDGLVSNYINSIIIDDNENIWLGTNKGLSKFIINENKFFY